MALNDEFGVVSAIPPLEKLKQRLPGSTEPGAKFEIDRIGALIEDLNGGDTTSG